MTESADSPLRVRPQAPGNATPNAPDSTARPNGRTDSYLNLTEEERLAIATMVTEDDTPVDNWFSENSGACSSTRCTPPGKARARAALSLLHPMSAFFVHR